MEIQKLKFKEKRNLVESIVSVYKKIKFSSELELNLQKHKNETQIKIPKELNSGLSAFERIMSFLQPIDVFVIKKEFLEDSPKNWFQEHWSKSTYYKYVTTAIDNFLFYFYG
ncbi:MG284/MPN403 family protein [Mesomycoplasma lagogenitalium]|uniref:Uncharacterized protein n=1 Tax=Mesomycoplasma lagogenitalium TaxID=171286 RepID=A0ABY8LT20_9BACT|nr:hypothetical protein [Mesomycoplasma lagogenitalium]WGI36395.1 hypothetical protein QEG99_02890 [Mesomycoplasma lagogenitalium]